jgi:hypothetical protein
MHCKPKVSVSDAKEFNPLCLILRTIGRRQALVRFLSVLVRDVDGHRTPLYQSEQKRRT